MAMDLLIVIMSIFQGKVFDNLSIFSHMLTKLPKFFKKGKKFKLVRKM